MSAAPTVRGTWVSCWWRAEQGRRLAFPARRVAAFRLTQGGRRHAEYQLGRQAALVTGAASGIGFATAAMLGRGGACVAVNVLPDDPCGTEACGRP